VNRRTVSTVVDIVALMVLLWLLYGDRAAGPAVWWHTARLCRLSALQLGQLAIECERRYYRAVAP
jgi:hypothetical protein